MDDDDLTEDFLDSLDSLTVIPTITRINNDETSLCALYRPTASRLSNDDSSNDDVTEAANELSDIMSVKRDNTIAFSTHDETEYDEEDEDEHTDIVTQLDTSVATSTISADTVGSHYNDASMKMSLRIHNSDCTDRSFSFASECTDFSPPHSPKESGTFQEDDREDADTTTTSYADRLEVSVATGSVERNVHMSLKPFTMQDIDLFDTQFGREEFLDDLARSFVVGSTSKGLASYRQSYRHSTQSQSDVIKQGWLMKRGEFVRSWRKRWFTLRRMPQGPMLTYSKDNSQNAPAKVVELCSTSRCVIPLKPSKDHEFRIQTSADLSGREYAIHASSNYELTEWIRAIQLAINAGNKSSFEGCEDFQRIWNETGIRGFLVRYGIRKCSARNHLQTRVLELNFADQTITISRRGESLKTLHFSDVQRVELSTVKFGSEQFGIVLDFSGRNRSWHVYLDTCETRDDLLEILQKIATKDVQGQDLEARCSRLRLKCGYMERRHLGPHATLKGRLFVCLYEKSIVFFPDGEDVNCKRPWYVVTLRQLNVSCNDGKCIVGIGRLALTCATPEESRAWYSAIVAAMSMPREVIEVELKERVKIRNAYHTSLFRLRRLLKANVKPEVNGPPKDQKMIELFMRELWRLTFPGEEYTSNADPRWQEIGFQRGGPASDLRSSGLLGLYCLIYFVTYPSDEFSRILVRTRHGVSQGDMKNYPLAIGCINVVAILTETLGFGDAGSHSEGCSLNAMKTYVRFIANTITEQAGIQSNATVQHSENAGFKELNDYESWDEVVKDIENHVFENMFCVLYPILDMFFVDMKAGYMEFNQVVASFRRRLGEIFDTLPTTMTELQILSKEPCTDTLVAPSIISKSIK